MQAASIVLNWPLLAAAATFVLLALAEVVIPLRAKGGGAETGRILHNVCLGIMAMLLSALFPVGIYTGAAVVEARGLGLFQVFPAPWPAMLATTLLLHSLTQYWLHRASHRFGLLWRLHTVHHSDERIDLSTALRNHPLELTLSLPLALGVNLVLGIGPDLAVLAATIAYSASFWQHAAIRLPAKAERILETVLVTPALHRVHHAPERALHDSNFGDYLIVWDRLFGTFRGPPPAPDRVGLDNAGPDPDRLASLILWPIGLMNQRPKRRFRTR